MKTFKRFSAILLAVLMMVAMMAAPASAATDITIKNATDGTTYTAYRLFGAAIEGGNPIYKIADTDPWYDFVEAQTSPFTLVPAGGAEYFVTPTSATGAEIAAAALDNIPSGFSGVSVTATGETATISLDDGYYVMKSSNDTKFAFTVVNGAILVGGSGYYTTDGISEKNKELPTLEKTYTKAGGATGTAAVGDTVEFTIEIETEAGSNNYTIHDEMSGLKFNDNIVVKYTPVSGSETTWVKDTDYTVATTPGDGCSFHVAVTGKTFNAFDKIVITYTAEVLNASASNTARIDGIAGSGGGDVHTYGFTLTKTDNASNGLAGATFVLYDAGDNSVISLVKDTDHYRPKASTDAAGDVVTEVTTPSDGVIKFDGLALGSYYLMETKAPAGYVYNAAAKYDVTLTDAAEDGILDTNPDFTVVNTPGVALPETGGIGTTIFYAVGGVLMVGALALVLLRKRTGAN